MHLFDINVPGKITFKESDTLKSGNNITVVDTDLGKIGIGICYDIRFPELSRIMALKGADILVFPGAFNMTTGPAHWETLIRTRAIDNQVFVAAASPASNNDADYIAYGHSMVCNPWGQVVSCGKFEEKIIYAKIDLKSVPSIREELPDNKWVFSGNSRFFCFKCSNVQQYFANFCHFYYVSGPTLFLCYYCLVRLEKWDYIIIRAKCLCLNYRDFCHNNRFSLL